MGGNSESARNVPLTILSLCDRLQDLLIENGMEDAPVVDGCNGLGNTLDIVYGDWSLRDGKVVYG